MQDAINRFLGHEFRSVGYVARCSGWTCQGIGPVRILRHNLLNVAALTSEATMREFCQTVDFVSGLHALPTLASDYPHAVTMVTQK
eukprot:2428570-Amphidinium_carterae.1